MLNYPILGIAGLKRSGKNTVSGIVSSERLITEIAFADPIKRIVMSAYECSPDLLWTTNDIKDMECLPFFSNKIPELKEKLTFQLNKVNQTYKLGIPSHKTNLVVNFLCENKLNYVPRAIFQNIGTEWGRANSPGCWIKICLEACHLVLSGNFTYFKEAGLYKEKTDHELVVIPDVRFRDEALAVKKAGGVLWKVVRSFESTDSHTSEKSVNDIPESWFNTIIDNTGSLGDLKKVVLGHVKRYL